MERTESLQHTLALAFDVLIVFLIVAGSLWIMIDMSTGLMGYHP
jgi:heme/copper-type cytochrome/quinol oxidase subunit 4